MKQQICILGSTGSIGTQALEVIRQHPDRYEAYALTANNHWKLLAQQAREFHPAAVVIANETHYEALKEALRDEPDTKVYAGRDAVCQIVEAGPITMVLTAWWDSVVSPRRFAPSGPERRSVWPTRRPWSWRAS